MRIETEEGERKKKVGREKRRRREGKRETVLLNNSYLGSFSFIKTKISLVSQISLCK